MKCKKYSYIDEYLKGGLGENTKKEFEEHLKECAECSNEIESFRSISEKLAGFEVPDPGAEYFKNSLAKIMAAAKKADQKKASSGFESFFFGFGLSKTLAYASLVLLIILSVTLLNRQNPDFGEMTLYIEELNPYQEIGSGESAASYIADLEEEYLKEMADKDPEELYDRMTDYAEYEEEEDEKSFLLGLSEEDFKAFMVMFKQS